MVLLSSPTALSDGTLVRSDHHAALLRACSHAAPDAPNIAAWHTISSWPWLLPIYLSSKYVPCGQQKH